MSNPLSEWEEVIGYQQYKVSGQQVSCQWHIDGVWNDRTDPECRGMDIVKILTRNLNRK